MRQHFFFACLLALAFSCGSKDPKSGETGQAVADSTQTTDSSAVAKEPTINIEETTVLGQLLMVMSDSAASPAEIGAKLGPIFEKIGGCAAKCKMENSGPPVAWYNGPNAPWKFVAGLPYKTKCANPESGISNREIKGGKAVVVHFFGPYEMSAKAYEAAQNYLKEKNLTPSEPPYEIYIGDPMVEKDPYKVQTDVVFPIN